MNEFVDNIKPHFSDTLESSNSYTQRQCFMTKKALKGSELHDDQYMEGSQFKEIREYMIELKSYFETYDHADQRIKKLEDD